MTINLNIPIYSTEEDNDEYDLTELENDEILRLKLLAKDEKQWTAQNSTSGYSITIAHGTLNQLPQATLTLQLLNFLNPKNHHWRN